MPPAPLTTRRTGLLVAGLAVAVMNIALLQTLIVPVLSVIATQLDADVASVGWALTANLLAAAVLTPILGRLGEILGKRRVILGILAAVMAGTLIALFTSSLPLLIVARVLQGASYGIFPLSIAVLRDVMPRERLTMAMSVVSGMLGAGGVVGLVGTGLLTRDGGDYHHPFWVGLAVTVLAAVLCAFSLPTDRPPVAERGSVDWAGAFVLGLGLVLLLLPISQGHVWGWGSPATVGSFMAAVLVLGGWIQLERRTAEPLVAPAMLARRSVLVPNVAGLLTGFGMFAAFLSVSSLVQIPHEVAGYGFTASVLVSSAVYLLPGGVAGIVLAPFLGALVGRRGGRVTLVGGAVIGFGGFAGLALFHDHPWQVVVLGTLAQIAITFAFAALPALLVQAVEPQETGIANSVNSIARSVGSAIASALTVTLLTGSPDPATGLPRESSFVLVMVLGAAAYALIVAVALIGLPRHRTRRPDPLVEVEEAMAYAGEFSTISGIR